MKRQDFYILVSQFADGAGAYQGCSTFASLDEIIERAQSILVEAQTRYQKEHNARPDFFVNIFTKPQGQKVPFMALVNF